ncbi:YrbL family protein [Malaciobacter mytili]|uniref:YrbL family protein n=1 Tax=Malaciobacter mytili TaxID=603050 RepID=UPI003A861E38
MVELNEKYLVNKGTNRACYIYPNEKNKCIKIDLKDNKETKREIKYYKLLQKKSISFKMLSKYFSSIKTSLGQGEVFELIIDYDGKVSTEVDKYLTNKTSSNEDIKNIISLIPKLKQYLYKEKIYVKDLNPVNIVFQKLDKLNYRLVIIDGLAHSNYNPFFYFFDYFLLKKINKSWKNFITTVKENKLIKENRELKDILKDL